MRTWHDKNIQWNAPYIQITTHNSAHSYGQFGQMVECSFISKVLVGLSSFAITLTSDIAPVSSKEFLDIEANTKFGFTPKFLHDMIRTYSQMLRTDKYSELSLIIWSVWRNCWVFVCELSVCGFESRCSCLNFRYCACFEQRVPWYSEKYRVSTHSEMRTWHKKNIQSNSPYR